MVVINVILIIINYIEMSHFVKKVHIYYLHYQIIVNLYQIVLHMYYIIKMIHLNVIHVNLNL